MKKSQAASLVAARVKRDFRAVPRPSRLTNLSENADSEAVRIAEVFRGRHWGEIDAPLVQNYPEALSFFSPEAFHFFLPGYLILALEDRTGMDVSLDSMLSSLAGPTF